MFFTIKCIIHIYIICLLFIALTRIRSSIFYYEDIARNNDIELNNSDYFVLAIFHIIFLWEKNKYSNRIIAFVKVILYTIFTLPLTVLLGISALIVNLIFY